MCHYHGARSGAPIRTGRYSAVLGKYADAYNESLADERLLDMRETLAVLDAVCKRAMARAVTGDTPDLRKRALALLREEKTAEAMTLLADGVTEDREARELSRTVSKFQRAQESVWRLLLARQNVTNVQEQTVLFARMLDIVGGECGKDVALRVARRFDSEVMGSAGKAQLAEKAGGSDA